MGEQVRLRAADGHELDAYVARPQGTPKAGLVVAQEIFGVNCHIRGVADGYAADGFLVIAPALFDRVERKVELGYQPDDVTRGRAIRGKIGWDQVALDLAPAIAEVKPAGKVGIVGYCWGGSVAWLAACRSGVDAAVCYYGGNIHELRNETPRCPVMLHFGEEDQAIPLDQVEAVRKLHPEATIHLYPAGHGFNCEQRGSYHAESARLARERTLAFLGTQLR
ncbi:MAG: dienelactone hydrolase family protein [Kiloniellales bacterium]